MDFIEEVAEEYEDVRQEHYETLTDRRYCTLNQSRQTGKHRIYCTTVLEA